MKNSLRTKIALVSLVFVSSIAYAKKNNNKQGNKAVFHTIADGVAAQAAATAAHAKPVADNPAQMEAAGQITKLTTKNPGVVEGNLFVNGRVYGQFYKAGTDVAAATTKVNSTDLAHVKAQGAVDANNQTTVPVTAPVLIDDATMRSITANDISTSGNATVGGNLRLGNKRYVGQFDNWDPAVNMIILTFADTTAAGKPARINWSFATTTTWTAGAALARNEPVAVVVSNGGIPDIVSPLRPGRSFVSNTDMLYTNTVYVWTTKNNAGLGSRATNTLNAGGANFFNINRPRQAAFYQATNQDLTLTSSVRNVYSDGGQTAANILSGKMGWGLTSNSIGGTFHSTQLRITGANNPDGTPAFFSTTSPFSNHNGNNSGTEGASATVTNGTLFYEMIGSNVTDVALGYTWDKSATLVSVLTGFTTAQLNTLLATLIALLGVSARGPQPTSREAIIELLSKHGDLLKKTGILNRMINA